MGGRVGPDSHFDAVIVGSGFGGSVVAYRLAAAGKRVCVLERGKPYPPGSFARSPRDMGANFWDPSEGLHGLFSIWSFRGIEAVVSSGLGGGSLIYANVLLRKDERWFVDEHRFDGGYERWPISRDELDSHYDEVERMLDGQRFPLSEADYRVRKTLAMRDAARSLELEWQLPKLAVTFANGTNPPVPGEPIPEPGYGNIHGLTRTTCRLCGECDIGCNYGSKNTLDHTYLSAAAHHGADIRTRCEVRRLAPVESGGYAVGYVEHRPEAEGRKTDTSGLPIFTVTADRLVLAAGALGSPYLLLRNRAAFPALSDALGSRFSGNGDLLGFLLKARDGKSTRVLDGSRGPVITSAVRVPDAVDGGEGRGFYIEDAGYPQFVNWMLEATQVPGTLRRAARFVLHNVWARLSGNTDSDLGAEISSLLGAADLSSSSLPLLGMGRDVPDGVMRLRGRKRQLDIDWTIRTSREYFARVRTTMAAMADALGADFRDSPLWWLKRVITVHPLGGCPMGRQAEDGVVDAWGQAFGHEGLYVVDGAAMPGPVGANPALTIAAFADRVADGILDARPASARASARAPSQQAALSFTEEMKGYVSLGEQNYERGFSHGKEQQMFCMFHLAIGTQDVDRFIADPRHEGTAAGWVECAALGGRMSVERGIFNLFVDDDDPTRTTMRYRLHFSDPDGKPLTLAGFKDVHDDPGLDLWSDTSTLYTRILAGHVAEGEDETSTVVASGILRIYMQDFAKQLTTFRVTAPTAVERGRALARFGKLFAGTLWDLYAPRAREMQGTP